MTQPLPPQFKKSNPWKIATVLLLIALIAMGTIIGLLWTEQVKQSEYTRAKVYSDGMAQVTLGGEMLIFYYNWMGENAWNGTGYVHNPIEVKVAGSDIDRILPPIQGRTYSIAGFEIVVSEVYNDYVILLVRLL